MRNKIKKSKSAGACGTGAPGPRLPMWLMMWGVMLMAMVVAGLLFFPVPFASPVTTEVVEPVVSRQQLLNTAAAITPTTKPTFQLRGSRSASTATTNGMCRRAGREGWGGHALPVVVSSVTSH